MSQAYASFVDPRRRHAVLVGLFDAVERSGARPVDSRLMHTLWYLSNALAPAWGLPPFDSAVLKTEGQPYFPSLQLDIDSLVGMGMLVVAEIRTVDEEQRMQGRFVLNRQFADRVLAVMREIPEDRDLLEFLDDVVQAANRLSGGEQVVALTEDATYGDPGVDSGTVIDLGLWARRDATTPTQYILDRLRSVAGRDLMPAELMEMYVDHLGRRLRNGK